MLLSIFDCCTFFPILALDSLDSLIAPSALLLYGTDLEASNPSIVWEVCTVALSLTVHSTLLP